MITAADAVSSLRPNVEWVMYGDDVPNIIWHTPKVKPLTTDEVDAEIIRLKKAATDKAGADAAATAAAVGHAKSLGFTDAMIRVMYPNLVTGEEPLVVGRESLNIPANINNDVTLDTVTP